MEEKKSFNFGEQPLNTLLQKHELKGHDIVDISDEHITHKMVSKACKGRRLTPNIQNKILRALNKISGENYTLWDTFNYGPHTRKDKKCPEE